MNRVRTTRLRTRPFVVPPSGGSTIPRDPFAKNRLKAELRTGFTLVEMLVAVTLVLLMMVMFGEIFQMATGSVTKQRIMADNDQNVRTFVTVLRADLDKRTFRTLVPFFPGELSSNPGTPFEKRRGYFYISNNNISDGTDDVLQFTVDSTVELRNSDETPYYGHAVPLTAGTSAFLTNPNQPDRDDSQVVTNDAGSSRAAEVSYWLRGGRLYRRVMLVREPLKGSGVSSDPGKAAQPTSSTGVDYFAGSYGGNFWNDFDYSAHRMPGSLAALLSLPTNARFNGLDYLSNDTSELPHPLPTPAFPANTYHPFAYSLGQTWNRFGHNSEIAGAAPANIPAAPYVPLQNGLPREFTTATPSAAVPLYFVGRLTQEETSKAAAAGSPSNFSYPQTLCAAPTTPPGAWNGNPMDAVGTEFTLNTNTAAVNEFQSGAAASRIGVDLLLSNVHEFRVEAWDQRIGDFAPIGHSIGAGDYNVGRQLNPTYLPLGGVARIFDTWHPFFDRNFNIPTVGLLGDVADRPPFRALTWNPTVPTTDPAFPPGPTPVAPFQRGYWAPGTTYSIGDVVFPRTEDLNGNGILDAGEDDSAGFAPPFGVTGQADDSPQLVTLIPNKHPYLQFRPFGLTYAYRCIKGGTTLTGIGNPASTEPIWSSKPGFVIRGQVAAEPDWVVDYNVRPLRAIRITVRFEHPQSKQMKQITIVHSLRDTSSVP